MDLVRVGVHDADKVDGQSKKRGKLGIQQVLPLTKNYNKLPMTST